MVSLDEGFSAELPVAWHDLGDVDRLISVFQIEVLEVLGQDFEIGEKVLSNPTFPRILSTSRKIGVSRSMSELDNVVFLMSARLRDDETRG